MFYGNVERLIFTYEKIITTFSLSTVIRLRFF